MAKGFQHDRHGHGFSPHKEKFWLQLVGQHLLPLPGGDGSFWRTRVPMELIMKIVSRQGAFMLVFQTPRVNLVRKGMPLALEVMTSASSRSRRLLASRSTCLGCDHIIT